MAGGLASAAVDHLRAATPPAERVGARVDRILHDLNYCVIGGRSPNDSLYSEIAWHHWQCINNAGVSHPEEDLASTAKLPEFAEDKLHRFNDMLVGIALDSAIFTPAESGRQCEPQLAALRLRIARGKSALAHEAELVFRDRPLKPEQQAVVHLSRIENAAGRSPEPR